MSSGKESKAERGVEKYFFRVSARCFEALPGSPLAYWAPVTLFSIFANSRSFNDFLEAREGLTTGNNQKYVRFHFEVSRKDVGRGFNNRSEAQKSGLKWFPYNKGGEFRKWYGNDAYVVNWFNDGKVLQETLHPLGERVWAHNFNLDYIFKPSVSWSDITTKGLSARLFPGGFLFDATGLSAFERKDGASFRFKVAAICNSKIGSYIAPMLNPTMHFKSGDFAEMPATDRAKEFEQSLVESAYSLSVSDWDSYETSWDFTSLPLLSYQLSVISNQVDESSFTEGCKLKTGGLISEAYAKLRAHWREMTLEMQRLEEENNRIFIEAYGLQDELTPEVPLNEITLTCNPYYRYNKKQTTENTEYTENKETKTSVSSVYSVVKKSFPIDNELEALLLADTMRELVSYAVGCMFGRYALDKPGLILANQGETIEDYYKKVSMENTESTEKNNSVCSVYSVDQKSFPADDDNVIPMLDGDWFTDDIAERFREFLKVAFGVDHYEENLQFVEDALGKDIRKYFLRDFYNDHVRRYKKRPIYWLFSSPKGSFNALIYMHRYRPDTVSVVLNDYLREFRTKLTAHKNHLEAVSISASASQAEKTKALKEIEKITRMIAEMEEYEREVLYPLATEQVEIDLDDGVKVNYPKFGAALKKIVGLEAKED